jgi:hypothetical protein
MVLLAPNMGLSRKSLSDSQDVVSKWVAATSIAPHTEEVARSVVDTLTQIAHNPSLRQLIPAHVWSWLNERPSLPPVYKRHWEGGDLHTVRKIRALNDIGTLTSYLILTWSEWESLDSDHFAEMRMLVREDFNGIGMGCHRAELIQRLDYILGELDRRSRRTDTNLEDDKLWRNKVGPSSQVMRGRYREFRRVLQEVDQKATEILYRMPPSFIFFSLLILVELQNPTPPSCAPCPSCAHNLAFGTIGRAVLFTPVPHHRCSHVLSSSTPILPRNIPLGFSRCPSKGFCYSLLLTFFVYTPTLSIILVEHNSLGISSIYQQIMHRTLHS